MIKPTELTIGDPVQVVRNSNLLGTVIHVAGMSKSLVYVKLLNFKGEVSYFSHELRICKCATRIPTGVSQFDVP